MGPYSVHDPYSTSSARDINGLPTRSKTSLGTSPQPMLCDHESTKKREYAQCVPDVEHGVFTPLVLSTTGGMGREAVTF